MLFAFVPLFAFVALLARLFGARALGSLARRFGAEAFARLAFEECIERPVEQLAEVSVRQCVTQELPGSFDLVAELGSSGELHPHARGRERFEPARSTVTCSRAG